MQGWPDLYAHVTNLSLLCGSQKYFSFSFLVCQNVINYVVLSVMSMGCNNSLNGRSLIIKQYNL